MILYLIAQRLSNVGQTTAGGHGVLALIIDGGRALVVLALIFLLWAILGPFKRIDAY